MHKVQPTQVFTSIQFYCFERVPGCQGLIVLVCRRLHQGYVYAVGGNDGVASLSSVERFDPHLNKWTDVREMGQRRAGNGVSELNGCLYVVGKDHNLFV